MLGLMQGFTGHSLDERMTLSRTCDLRAFRSASFKAFLTRLWTLANLCRIMATTNTQEDLVCRMVNG